MNVLARKENNVIIALRYFFVLEILEQQTFNQASFNLVLFLSVLHIRECMIEGYNLFSSMQLLLWPPADYPVF